MAHSLWTDRPLGVKLGMIGLVTLIVHLGMSSLFSLEEAIPVVRKLRKAGGYIFKFEWQVMDIGQKLVCPSGQLNCWDYLEVADPDPWNQPQQDFLSQYLRSFVTGLHSATPADATAGGTAPGWTAGIRPGADHARADRCRPGS